MQHTPEKSVSPAPSSRASQPLGLPPMLNPHFLTADSDPAAMSGGAAGQAAVMSTSAMLQRRDSWGRQMNSSGSVATPSGLIAPSPRRLPSEPKQASIRSLAASRASPPPCDILNGGPDHGLQSDLRRIVDRPRGGAGGGPHSSSDASSHTPVGSHAAAGFLPAFAEEESPMQASVRSNRTPSHQQPDSDDSTTSFPPTAVCRAAAASFRRDRSSRHKHGLVSAQREMLQLRASPTSHSGGSTPSTASVSPSCRAAAAAADGGIRGGRFGGTLPPGSSAAVVGPPGAGDDDDLDSPHAVLLEGLLTGSAAHDDPAGSPTTPARMNTTISGSTAGATFA